MELLISNLENSTIVVNYETCSDRKVVDLDLDNSVCWYDCHPFKSPPVFLPTYYNKDASKWYCTGIFCSWSCAKGYAQRYKKDTSTLSYMYRKLNPNKGVIPNPYPREALKMFGGYLDITTFRKRHPLYTVKYTEAPIIHSLPQQLVTQNISIVPIKSQKFVKNTILPKKSNNIENVLFG